MRKPYDSPKRTVLVENEIMTEPICKTYANGTKHWWLNGNRHRSDGPAIEYANGYKAWFLNGKRHRTDGPAVECSDGTKHWYLNGKLHRTDGPAIEWPNGTKQWFLNDKYVSMEDVITDPKEQFWWRMKS